MPSITRESDPLKAAQLDRIKREWEELSKTAMPAGAAGMVGATGAARSNPFEYAHMQWQDPNWHSGNSPASDLSIEVEWRSRQKDVSLNINQNGRRTAIGLPLEQARLLHATLGHILHLKLPK